MWRSLSLFVELGTLPRLNRSRSASNALVSIEAGQEREGEAGQRVRQGNMNKHVNFNVNNTGVLPEGEKCVA